MNEELTPDQLEIRRIELLRTLDEAVDRLKKRISLLTEASLTQIIDPSQDRMIAFSPGGDLYVAVNGDETGATRKISFQYAPLAQIKTVLRFGPTEESYVDAVTRSFANVDEDKRLTGIRIVTLREFSGLLAEVLKVGLVETEQTIKNIQANE